MVGDVGDLAPTLIENPPEPPAIGTDLLSVTSEVPLVPDQIPEVVTSAVDGATDITIPTPPGGDIPTDIPTDIPVPVPLTGVIPGG